MKTINNLRLQFYVQKLKTWNKKLIKYRNQKNVKITRVTSVKVTRFIIEIYIFI